MRSFDKFKFDREVTKYICILLFSITLPYSIIKAQVAGWTVKNPFEQKVFIENKGQFDNANGVPGTDIQYVIDNSGTRIYFTSTGLTYEFKKYERIKNDQDEDKISYNERERGENNIKVEKIVVHMQWEGAIPATRLIVEEKVPDYYTYADTKKSHSTIIANAYKKLIYKSLYPGIDVEYVFHESEGIKYSFVLHPGADASIIKMKYSSANEVLKDAAGNIHLTTKVGDIIDHAPETFYDNTAFPIHSSFNLKGNIVAFDLGDYDKSKTIIIDPWTTNPAFAGVNKAYDIDKDGAGNIYISGGGSPFYLKKFTPTGTLLWTFSYTAPPANSLCYYGDHCVDNSGNSYLSYGAWGGVELTKVNAAGTLIYSKLNTYTGQGIEGWRLTINCTLGEITGGGFYNDNKTSPTLWSINPANGTYSNYVNPVGGSMTNEVRALTNDEAGNIYALTVDMSGTAGTYNRIIKTTSSIGGGLSSLFNVSSGYTLNESNCGYALGGNYSSGFSGINAIAVGCDLYTFNGLTLKRWDRNTGVQLGASVTVPGGIANAGDVKNTGIVLDKCGNVYVGITNGVVKYDRTLNQITTAATPAGVYDICLGNTPGEIIACGNGFISSVNMNVCLQFNITKSSTPSLACSPCSGTATVSVPGACNLSYLWAPSGQTGTTATALCPGKHTITVQSGCSSTTDSVVITNNAGGITLNISQTITGCGSPGSATVAVTGGSAPFVYNWSTGQTTATATGLNAGSTYTVTVTDNSGCVSTQQVTISNNAGSLNLSFTKQNISCSGGSNGSITANATGGTTPYTYLWNNGKTTQTITGLVQGNYTVTITDKNGCWQKQTVNIASYAPITLTTSSTPSNCIISGTGTVTVVAAGGAGSYTYSWLAPVQTSYSGNTNVGQLKSGTYTVVVTDGNGCSNTGTVSVGQTPPPVAGFTISPNKVICLGNSVTVTNTSSNPTINWQLYNYTITPSFSTTGTGNTFTYTFNTPPGVGIFNIYQYGSVGGCAFNKTDTIAVVNCPASGPAPAAFGGGCIGIGDCSKKLTAGVTGGTAPYTYNWSTGATTSVIYPCPTAAGVYTVTVTDAGGLSATTTVAVSILPSSAFTPGPLANVCIGSTVNFVGATTPGATYNWTIYDNPAVSGTTANFSHTFLSVGRYSIFRSAGNGSCGTQYRDTINVINCSGPSVTATGSSVCPGSCTTVTSTGTGGTSPYIYSWSNGSTTQNINPCPLTTTIYTVTIRDAGGTTATTTATVNINPAVSVIITPTNITCNGGTNGSATAAGTSGTAPFTYNWSGGVPGTGFQVSGLSSGTYIVTVTDNKGCTGTSSVTIAAPPALSGQFTKGTASCVGCGCKEWLMLTASGGTSPYSYTWPDGYLNRYKNQLCPGSYNVNIKDKNGCSVNVNLTTP